MLKSIDVVKQHYKTLFVHVKETKRDKTRGLNKEPCEESNSYIFTVNNRENSLSIVL